MTIGSMVSSRQEAAFMNATSEQRPGCNTCGRWANGESKNRFEIANFDWANQ